MIATQASNLIEGPPCDVIRWGPVSHTHSQKSQLRELPPWIAASAQIKTEETAAILGSLWRGIPTNPLAIPKNPSKRYYKKFSKYFYSSYFFKNLYKSIVLTSIFHERLSQFDSFIDLGSGSAPFSTAISIRQHLREVSLVDRSKSHLGIGKKILRKTSKALKIKSVISPIEDCILDFSYPIISSYLFCELIDEKVDFSNIIEKSKFLLIIDNSNTIARIEAEFGQSGDFKSGQIEFSIQSSVSSLIEGSSGRFSYILFDRFC